MDPAAYLIGIRNLCSTSLNPDLGRISECIECSLSDLLNKERGLGIKHNLV
jgi:hypothetical protein